MVTTWWKIWTMDKGTFQERIRSCQLWPMTMKGISVSLINLRELVPILTNRGRRQLMMKILLWWAAFPYAKILNQRYMHLRDSQSLPSLRCSSLAVKLISDSLLSSNAQRHSKHNELPRSTLTIKHASKVTLLFLVVSNLIYIMCFQTRLCEHQFSILCWRNNKQQSGRVKIVLSTHRLLILNHICKLLIRTTIAKIICYLEWAVMIQAILT